MSTEWALSGQACRSQNVWVGHEIARFELFLVQK